MSFFTSCFPDFLSLDFKSLSKMCLDVIYLVFMLAILSVSSMYRFIKILSLGNFQP